MVCRALARRPGRPRRRAAVESLRLCDPRCRPRCRDLPTTRRAGLPYRNPANAHWPRSQTPHRTRGGPHPGYRYRRGQCPARGRLCGSRSRANCRTTHPLASRSPKAFADCGKSLLRQEAAIGNSENPWRFWVLPTWKKAMNGFIHAQLERSGGAAGEQVEGPNRRHQHRGGGEAVGCYRHEQDLQRAALQEPCDRHKRERRKQGRCPADCR